MAGPNVEVISGYRDNWYSLFMLWQRIHWCSLIFVTAGSAAVASNQLGALKDPLALAVAIVGAVYAALNPNQRAEAYREAWVLLNTAILGDAPPEKIVEAYSGGEQIIGRRPAPTK